MRQGVGAVEGCRGRTQCEERWQDGGYEYPRCVSGVVEWCLGAYSEEKNTYVHHLHTFLHTGSSLCNPLQRTRPVPRPHILYNTLQHSTTALHESTALQQFYSLQPLHHPSATRTHGWLHEPKKRIECQRNVRAGYCITEYEINTDGQEDTSARGMGRVVSS